MKLELKHLAPYLPYGLTAKIGNTAPMHVTLEMVIHSNIEDVPTISRGKNQCWEEDKYPIIPILRPLSDLTKEIEHNGDKFVPDQRLKKGRNDYEVQLTPSGSLHNETPYWAYNKLIEWHFDVFGLIDKGLAIDMNTI